MQNGPFFPQNGLFFPPNALFIHFSYEFRTFFIHSKIHPLVQHKYSFKKFIHSRSKQSFKIGGQIGKIEPRSTQINLIQVFIKLQSISGIL